MSPDDEKILRQDLQELRDRVFLMAGRVEVMLADAVRSLVERDRELAHATIAADRRVNRAEKESDALCMRILQHHCTLPPATVRFVTFALKMVTDLERIGDLAVDISGRSIELAGFAPLPVYRDIEQMGQAAGDMVKTAISAFVGDDAARARSVIEREPKVQAMHEAVFEQTLDLLVRDSGAARRCLALQAVARWLERAAAHATNLAEQVIFFLCGEDLRHQDQQLDQTLAEMGRPEQA